MPIKKPNKLIRYKRGRVEIEGETNKAWWLMLIDMLFSRTAIVIPSIVILIQVLFELYKHFKLR